MKFKKMWQAIFPLHQDPSFGLLFNFQKILNFEYQTIHSRELNKIFFFLQMGSPPGPIASTSTSRKPKSNLIPKILKERHRVHDPLQSLSCLKKKLVQFCFLFLQFIDNTMRDLENYQVGTLYQAASCK